MSSDSDSDDDYTGGSRRELLDGRGQSSLSNILRFIRAEGEQSSSSAGEAKGTGQKAAAPDPNKVLVELEKIQSSLRSMESRVKSLQQSPPKRSRDLSWADRCPSPSGIHDPSTWDEEIRDLSNGLAAPKLSENSMATVASSFSKPLANEERKRLRNMFPPPDLPETKCPRLDSVFKSSAVKKEAKDSDGEFARLQAFIHDPAAPLIAMLHDMEQEDEDCLSVEQFKAALYAAIQLLGNASAQVSRLTEIQDLAEEDIFSAAAPYLFGEGFEPKMKDRAESLKILSSAKPQQQNKQFFRGSRPTAPQRGGGSNRGGKSWWSRKGKQPHPTRK